MSGLRIAAVRLLCPQPVATAHFFASAFDAHVDLEGPEPRATLGAQTIVFAPATAERDDIPPSNATSFQHFAIVVADMVAAVAKLDSVPGWTAISRAGPERLPASSGGVTAFKFRDPDGHPLELLQFAPGAVPAVWRNGDGVFLGIDHTAIAVADTARAVAFYADLGFVVTTQGVNRGPEQERMDDIDAPVVEVTALTPPGGAPPHLELLCYREPGTIAAPAGPGDVLATTILLDGDAGRSIPTADPDGHRLAAW